MSLAQIGVQHRAAASCRGVRTCQVNISRSVVYRVGGLGAHVAHHDVEPLGKGNWFATHLPIELQDMQSALGRGNPARQCVLHSVIQGGVVSDEL